MLRTEHSLALLPNGTRVPSIPSQRGRNVSCQANSGVNEAGKPVINKQLTTGVSCSKGVWLDETQWPMPRRTFPFLLHTHFDVGAVALVEHIETEAEANADLPKEMLGEADEVEEEAFFGHHNSTKSFF